jgi:phage-related protein
VKPLTFLGSSQEDLRNFPAEARRAAGFEMSFVQQGLMPSDWKPLKEVGSGAMEIRIHVLGEWRVVLSPGSQTWSTSSTHSGRRHERHGKRILI